MITTEKHHNTSIRSMRGFLDDACILLFFVAIFAYMPTARSFDRNVWIILFGLLLLNTIKNFIFYERSFVIDLSLLWYVVFVFIGCLTIFWTKNSSQLLLYLVLYFPVIILGVLSIGHYISMGNSVDKIMYLMMAAGCIAAFRFLCYTPLDEIFSSGFYLRGTFGSLLDDVTNYNNYTSHLCIICIVAAFYAIVRQKKICYLPFIFLFAILIFGGSRKNLIVIPVVCLVFIAINLVHTKKLKTLLFCLIIFCILVYLFFTLDFLEQIRNAMFEMFNGISNNEALVDESTQTRLNLLERAKEVWGEHIFFGVGWDSFCKYNVYGISAHNNYMELLASLGIIGFTVYYSYYLYVIVKCVKGLMQGKNLQWNSLMLGVIFGYIIQEFGSVTAYNREKFIILLLVMLCYSISTKERVYKIEI